MNGRARLQGSPTVTYKEGAFNDLPAGVKISKAEFDAQFELKDSFEVGSHDNGVLDVVVTVVLKAKGTGKLGPIKAGKEDPKSLGDGSVTFILSCGASTAPSPSTAPSTCPTSTKK